MIYLISGSPRAGKSTLSRMLAKKLSISYLSTDNIRPMLWAQYKGREKDEKFPFEKMFSAEKIDDYYKKYSHAEIFKADLIETKTIWKSTESFINYLLLCNMDYIVEGLHLLPKLLKKYQKDKRVKILYLVKTDSDQIYTGLIKNKKSAHHDWLVHNAKHDETLAIAAKSISEYGKYFVRETDKYGFLCINTESDFHYKLQEASDCLEK